MSKDVIVKSSKIHKKGVFAARDFKKGETVLKYHPKILKKSDIKKMTAFQRHYVDRSGKDKYLLMQAPEKFVNHSCEPNTRVKNNSDVAIRNIKKGEEITSDYGKSVLVTFKCKCGCKKCKKIVNS